MPASRPIKDRLWDKVDKKSQRPCWIWTGSKDTKGFGRIALGIDAADGPLHKHKVGIANMGVHQVAYALRNGIPPKHSRLYHTCDNRSCVNPKHIKLGPCPIKDRFWEKVDKNSERPCWIWTGHIQKNGHGEIPLGTNPLDGPLHKDVAGLYDMPAHRVSYILAFGTIRKGKRLHHRCKNPDCVNPKHLKVACPPLKDEHLNGWLEKDHCRAPACWCQR